MYVERKIVSVEGASGTGRTNVLAHPPKFLFSLGTGNIGDSRETCAQNLYNAGLVFYYIYTLFKLEGEPV